MVTGSKGKGGGKEGLGSSKTCHFCHKKCDWKKDCKYRQEWLKNKRQTVEADIAEGVLDTYMLTAFIDKTSTDKSLILDYDNAFYVSS